MHVSSSLFISQMISLELGRYRLHALMISFRIRRQCSMFVYNVVFLFLTNFKPSEVIHLGTKRVYINHCVCSVYYQCDPLCFLRLHCKTQPGHGGQRLSEVT